MHFPAVQPLQPRSNVWCCLCLEMPFWTALREVFPCTHLAFSTCDLPLWTYVFFSGFMDQWLKWAFPL